MGLRIVSGIAMLAFVMSILVQFNDPDGWVWILIYLCPAAFAGAGLFGKVEFMALPVSGLYMAGAAILMPWQDLDQLLDYVSQWQMKNDNAEYAREAIGLFLCAAYLEFTGIVWVLRRPRGQATTEGN